MSTAFSMGSEIKSKSTITLQKNQYSIKQEKETSLLHSTTNKALSTQLNKKVQPGSKSIPRFILRMSSAERIEKLKKTYKPGPTEYQPKRTEHVKEGPQYSLGSRKLRSYSN